MPALTLGKKGERVEVHGKRGREFLIWGKFPYRVIYANGEGPILVKIFNISYNVNSRPGYKLLALTQ